MKKSLLFSLVAISGYIGSIESATVTIKNTTKKPIWARINNEMYKPHPEDVGNQIIGGMLTFGILPAIREAQSTRRPYFVKIPAGKSQSFDSGALAIKKISFVHDTSYTKIEQAYPHKKANYKINENLLAFYYSLGSFITNVPAKFFDKEGKEVMMPKYEYLMIRGKERRVKAGEKAKKKFLDENVTKIDYNIPTFVVSVVNPDIGPLTLGANIVYNGPRNIVKIENPLFGKKKEIVLKKDSKLVKIAEKINKN